MFRLSRKLKLLKTVIRAFSKDNYSDLEKRVAESYAALILLQNKTLMAPNTLNAARSSEEVDESCKS